MEFLLYLLIAAIAWYAINQAIQKAKPNGGLKHCMTCGLDSIPKTVTKGSIGIEVILWLCFLIPGVLYSIWRLTTKTEACTGCGGTTLIPCDSPAAVAHKKQLQA
jgi:hypothetical protein